MAESVHKSNDSSKDGRLQEMIKSIINQVRNCESENLPKTSIYEVPSKSDIKDNNSPHSVSIGPIHGRGRADLLAMKEMKLRYSMFFFNRSEDLVKIVQECGQAIFNLIKQAREYYAHDLTKFNDYDLMKILLIDGCFLLELFLRHSSERECNKKMVKQGEINTTSNDLILDNPWLRSAVCKDLALLQNQIPLVVLDTLLSKIKPYLKSSNGVKDYTLKDYTLNFFGLNLNASNSTSVCIDTEPKPSKEQSPSQDSRPSEEPRHILEILHKSMLPSQLLQNGMKKHGLKFSATKLLESGINIKKKFDLPNETDAFNNNLLEIEFDKKNGILKIPPFWIGGTTSLITKNLVAFEQYSFGPSQSRHVTAYVLFMKSLLRSKRDIKLLKNKEIIQKQPGSGTDKSAVEFFNDCSKGVTMKDFYFSKVCEEVEEYSKNWMHFHIYVTCLQSRRHKYAAVLARQYCPDACRTIAFFAAMVLLILTCLQTFFTVYPYYHKRN